MTISGRKIKYCKTQGILAFTSILLHVQMRGQNGSLRHVWTCTRSAVTHVTEMKTFQPLCLHDVIISSIYNTEDKANTARDHRQQWLTDRVGTLISIIHSRLFLQIQASRCSCLDASWGDMTGKNCIDRRGNKELLLLHCARLPD